MKIFCITKDIIVDTKCVINEACNLNMGQNNLIHDLRKFEHEKNCMIKDIIMDTKCPIYQLECPIKISC